MFCPKCGTNFADDGKFCPNCGFRVPNQAGGEAAQPVAGASAAVKKSGPNKKLIIGLSIAGGALLVALIVCLIVFFVINNKVSAKIDLQISGYSTSNCTRIPVNVLGQNVDQTMFVDENGEGLQLKNGDYELSFPASPLCENGKFWSAPSETFNLSLKNGEFENAGENKIEFKDADMTKVTDSQIDVAATCAKVDEENTKDIDACVKNTKAARDKAIQDAEAERKAAEAAMRAELAKSQIVTGTYVSENGTYTLTVDVENLRYEIMQNNAIVDKGYFLDKDKGLKYYHDEAITPTGEYGKQCFIVVADKEFSRLSIAYRYLTFRDGHVFLGRKHDAGGSHPWETSYTFKR